MEKETIGLGKIKGNQHAESRKSDHRGGSVITGEHSFPEI